MESYYEINVAVNGRHFCRIKLAATNEFDAEAQFTIVNTAFKSLSMFHDKYECDLRYWDVRAKEMPHGT